MEREALYAFPPENQENSKIRESIAVQIGVVAVKSAEYRLPAFWGFAVFLLQSHGLPQHRRKLKPVEVGILKRASFGMFPDAIAFSCIDDQNSNCISNYGK